MVLCYVTITEVLHELFVVSIINTNGSCLDRDENETAQLDVSFHNVSQRTTQPKNPHS